MMNCQQHDYIEIACLYKLAIKLSLSSGDELKGIALDTQANESREECLIVNVDNKPISIPLNSIRKMEALTKNRHFDSITFD